jgi:hypothetical protein
MGFQLFVKGVFGADSDLEAVWGNRKLLLKRAGPGTLFALFGAAIICLAVFYGPTVPRR